ncbi:MAG: class I SAM-dependent methyltransferase [Anaerolineae bacterium]|nr:class I SAM-dependent methyltransferase [Anaerolineae bacterium]
MSRKSNKSLWGHILTILLKKFYTLLYHQFAWAYDAIAWIVSGGKWTEWGLVALPFLSGKQILELGHGPGHLQVKLTQKGYHVFGLDRSPQMIRQAQKRLKSYQFPFRLVRATAELLPFSNNSFDSVIATFPTEYIFKRETVQEIWRVLKVRGKFVTLVGVKIYPAGLYNRLLTVLYKSSRQEVPNDALLVQFLHQLNSAGLHGQIKWQAAAGGQLLLIICSKGKSGELSAPIDNDLL